MTTIFEQTFDRIPHWELTTHTLEELKLVKISSNFPRETMFTNKLRVSFLLCLDDSPHQKVLKGSSLD